MLPSLVSSNCGPAPLVKGPSAFAATWTAEASAAVLEETLLGQNNTLPSTGLVKMSEVALKSAQHGSLLVGCLTLPTAILLLLMVALLLLVLHFPDGSSSDESRQPQKKSHLRGDHKQWRKIPGPRPWPIIGDLLLLASRPKHAHLVLQDMARSYGAMFSFRMGCKDAVVLNDYDLIRSTFCHFTSRPSWYLVRETTHNGKGLVWQNGYPWKRLRKFSHVGLRNFGVGSHSLEERVSMESAALLAALQEYQGAPVSPFSLIQRATSNVTCSICFGNRFEYTDKRFCRLLDMIRKIFTEFSVSEPINFFPFLEKLPYSGRVRRSFKYLQAIDDLIEEQIVEHRKTFDMENLRDFVDLYLREEQEDFSNDDVFSDINIRLIIRDLFIAGSESTSTTIEWVILYLALHPDIQAKCYREIDQILGRTLAPTLLSRQQLTYIEATIMEIQRLSSAVPILLHQSEGKPHTFQDHVIPADAAIMANVYAVHRSREYWDEPDVFRPERFLNERGDIIRNKRGFLPYGIGPRQCPGMALAQTELFLFTTSLLQRFEMKLTDEGEMPSLVGELGITLAPERYKVRFVPREASCNE